MPDRRKNPHLIRKAIAALALALGIGALALAPDCARAQGARNTADDPVVAALGADVMARARQEGSVAWYGSEAIEPFLQAGAQAAFEKRFDIRIVTVAGSPRSVTDRIRKEAASGKPMADVVELNEQFQMELLRGNLLAQWRPPAPALDRYLPDVFSRETPGFWWPLSINAQGLVVNRRLVDPATIKSWWDVADPRFAGKVAIREPRMMAAGAVQILNLYSELELGPEYLKKLRWTANPVIVAEGSEAIRDAVLAGKFAIGFSARTDFFIGLPADTPLAFVSPSEGLAWTTDCMALLGQAPHPNAARVLMVWLLELAQLQAWADQGHEVPHPDIRQAIPQMSLTSLKLLRRIPDSRLADPKMFFSDMEKIFGAR